MQWIIQWLLTLNTVKPESGKLNQVFITMPDTIGKNQTRNVVYAEIFFDMLLGLQVIITLITTFNTFVTKM